MHLLWDVGNGTQACGPVCCYKPMFWTRQCAMRQMLHHNRKSHHFYKKKAGESQAKRNEVVLV
jgi:hypothetical protein